MPAATATSSGLGRRRWLILGVIGIAQLMVVLDLTTMNIALPSAQRALHFTTVDRQWVVTAYALAGFAGVSAIGGASVNFTMLVTARACQGAFAALLVPSALSLLNTIFAGAVTSYIAAHLAAARTVGRQALTGLALAHGYDTAFWWTVGTFAAGAVIGGALLRLGPLAQGGPPSPVPAQASTVPA